MKKTENSIIKIYNSHLPLLLALLFCWTLVNILVRYISGRMFDRLSDGRYYEDIMIMVILFVVEIFLSYNKKLQVEHFLSDVQCSFLKIIEETVFQLVQHKGNELQKGQLLNVFENDVNIVCAYLRRIYERFTVAILQYGFSFVLLLIIDPILAALAIVSSGIIFVVIKIGARSMGNAYADYQLQKDGLLKIESSGVFNLELLKVSNMEYNTCKRHREEIERTNCAQVLPAKLEAFLTVPSMLAAFLIHILLLGTAGFMCVKNIITSGELIMVITLVEYIVNLPMMLDGVISAYKKAKVSYQRILDIISSNEMGFSVSYVGNQYKSSNKLVDDRKAMFREACSLDAECNLHSITFHNISFGYTESKILNNVNLKFRKGTINVVRGANGRGKSTIMRLLKKLHDSYEGDIYLNERNLRNVPIDELNKMVAICPQEVYLYETSIRENLTLGKEIPLETLVSACEIVGIWDEIKTLENGIDTILYQNGQPLSVGQRQRIMIARTLLCQSEVMIFDEPTSSFRVDGQGEFLEILQKLAVDHIIIVISHDASLFLNCDINEVCL